MNTLAPAPDESSETAVDRAAEAALPKDPFWVRALSIITLALLACAATWHGWRKDRVYVPTDALKLVAPWGHDEKFIAANEQLLDQTVQFVPWTIYATERIKRGEIPLWNPHSQLGVPFIGNGQSAVFYPTTLLHLNLPETWSWTISAALRLFIAGLGAWILAGRYGLCGAPRWLSGAAFMLCGFNVVWLNHPQMNVMPLLPWAILCVEALLVRVNATRIALAALVFAIQFLGGHPSSCIHLLLACGAVVIVRLALRSVPPVRWIGGSLAIVFALALGFAIAAAQWLPLIEYANNSGASAFRKGNLQSAPIIDFAPQYLIGSVFPYANGYPDGVAPFEMRQATKLPNTNELAPGYIGVIPLLLAIAGIGLGLRSHDQRRRRIVLILVILGGLATAIAIRLPGADHLVRLVPALNVSQNARLLVVAALALAILAGFGLTELRAMLLNREDWPALRKWSLRVAAGIAALAVLLCLTLLIARGPIVRSGKAKAEAGYRNSDHHEHTLEYRYAMVERIHRELVYTSLRLLIPAALLAAVWLLIRSRRAANPWPWLALALIDLLVFAIPFNRGADASTYFPTSVAAIDELRKLPPARFAGTFRTMFPETATAYELSDIRGYDALAPRRYYEWWAHEGIGNLGPERQGYLQRLENPEHPAWSLLNFGYLVSEVGKPIPAADKWLRVNEGDDLAIYQSRNIRARARIVPSAEFLKTTDDVLDRVAKMDFDADKIVLIDEEGSPKDTRDLTHGGSGGTVQFLNTPRRPGETITPETVRLQVSGGGGWLVLADSFFPGWTAHLITGNVGQKLDIHPAYGVLRAVPIPSGTHIVEFSYRPWSWRIGAFVSLSAVCVLLLFFGFAIVKDRT